MESRAAAAPFLCGKKQPGRGGSVDCMLCRVKKTLREEVT